MSVINTYTCYLDIEKRLYSSLVLTMVLSQGESVPLQYYEHLNTTFVTALLRLVEDASDDGDSQQVRYCCYAMPRGNVVY